MSVVYSYVSPEWNRVDLSNHQSNIRLEGIVPPLSLHGLFHHYKEDAWIWSKNEDETAVWTRVREQSQKERSFIWIAFLRWCECGWDESEVTIAQLTIDDVPRSSFFSCSSPSIHFHHQWIHSTVLLTLPCYPIRLNSITYHWKESQNERERARDRENKLGRESLENGFHESLVLNLISERNKAILTPRQTQALLYFSGPYSYTASRKTSKQAGWQHFSFS